jgi:glycosyltransferase involved in cell wall biosynthesis
MNISTLFTGYFIYLFSSGNFKKVFTTHDHDVYLGKGIVSLLKRKMIQSIVKKSDKVVTLNDSMKRYMRERGFRIDAVIPNAISLSNYENSAEPGFILFAGRLVSHKKVEDLIKVYSEISADCREELVIIGSGPCRNELEHYAESLGLQGRVHFVSFLPRSQYRRYLSRCSVFAFPSEAEAFGVVIIEAMASGKPVIARNIIGPKDIISHGKDGFLFNNTGELSEYLKLLLSDEKLRKNLGKNARKTVEEKYTFSKVARAYLNLYENLPLQSR